MRIAFAAGATGAPRQADVGNDTPAVIFRAAPAAGPPPMPNARGGCLCDAFILDGGSTAGRAGLPVVEDSKQPIEIMRQVQIVAGSLVVMGAALGALLHPGFHALSAFVGAGLVFAGASGTCMMARLLALAPWNRRASPPVTA